MIVADAITVQSLIKKMEATFPENVTAEIVILATAVIAAKALASSKDIFIAVEEYGKTISMLIANIEKSRIKI